MTSPAKPSAKPTPTLALWNKLSAKPLGSRLFSAAVSFKAPYFGTVLPHVVEMRPGKAVVTAPKWWGIQNHIGTFHAIAACNLAEMAMGMLAEATVPTTHRWLPKGMTTEYLKITKGGLTATAELPELPDFDAITEGRDVLVPITFSDAEGKESVRAEITIWVTPKKK
ncbi:hotdog fold domain-containing protein [Dietzia sp.]|uniref:hotdog fold domain-containing protein n=1 Tax=Dietzia sp. TaxID=1871616 RepID=UPI002FD9BC34